MELCTLYLWPGPWFIIWMVSTTQAVGYEGASLGLTLSGGCGPVSTGLEAGMGLSFVGEMASGSSSLVIDTPFPFFFNINGVTSSQLAELLVLQVLFQ